MIIKLLFCIALTAIASYVLATLFAYWLLKAADLIDKMFKR